MQEALASLMLTWDQLHLSKCDLLKHNFKMIKMVFEAPEYTCVLFQKRQKPFPTFCITCLCV